MKRKNTKDYEHLPVAMFPGKVGMFFHRLSQDKKSLEFAKKEAIKFGVKYNPQNSPYLYAFDFCFTAELIVTAYEPDAIIEGFFDCMIDQDFIDQISEDFDLDELGDNELIAEAAVYLQTYYKNFTVTQIADTIHNVIDRTVTPLDVPKMIIPLTI